MHKEISPRQQARLDGEKRYFTGNPCPKGHIAQRMVSTGCCVICLYANSKRYNATNPDKVRESHRRYRNENRESVRNYDRQWRMRNPETVKASAKREREKHREQYKERLAKWGAKNKVRYNAARTEWRRNHPEVGKRYQKKYPEKMNARAAKRRSALLRAIPVWITQQDVDAINEIYKDAKRLSQETGTQYHVDHAIPLRGDSVCGLHVPWNLQILTASENFKKNNHIHPSAESIAFINTSSE